jgi:hypothetical protein
LSQHHPGKRNGKLPLERHSSQYFCKRRETNDAPHSRQVQVPRIIDHDEFCLKSVVAIDVRRFGFFGLVQSNRGVTTRSMAKWRLGAYTSDEDNHWFKADGA